MVKKTSRREFVTGTIGAAAALGLGSRIVAQNRNNAGGLPTRPLGRTGEEVSILCLGGWHIGAVNDHSEAIRMMHFAIDNGLTFFDNAWDYHGGGSEEIMGRALEEGGKRKQVFLMTKNCERDYEGSMENLEESLRRLRTNYIDLWQFHEMVYDNDPDWVFDEGGIEAAIKAQEQGKVRYIGFTGHKDPRIHLKMMEKPHPWDSAQMPINIMDAHFRSFQKEVVPVCLEKGTGVIGMKGMGGGQGMIIQNTNLTPAECLRYALSQPVSSQVVGMTSMEELTTNIELARNFAPLSEEEKKSLLARIESVATDGRYELFKTTKAFDGSHHRRQHGFSTG